MSAGKSEMSFWIRFLSDAGIPAGIAANYAVTFTEHRIQEDMLLDLSKEYLSEMGVATMGDVIAILRHAKSTHTKSTREKALKTASTLNASSTASPKRSTPASRTVSHYLGKDPEARLLSDPPPPPAPKISAGLASRLGNNTPTASPTARLRLGTTPGMKEEVPVPKKRRVLPEHEGRYKVIMPKGTTAKTKKILESKRKASAPSEASSSVFSRLGQDTVTKTTTVGQKFTVTGLASLGMGGGGADASSSVFGRLGGKTTEKRAASSTVPDSGDSEDEPDTPRAQLEYAGVLKSSTSSRRQALLAKKRALVAQRRKLMESKRRLAAKAESEVSTSSEGIFAYESASLGMSLQRRLGKPQPATSTTGNPVTRKLTRGASPTVTRKMTRSSSPSVARKAGPSVTRKAGPSVTRKAAGAKSVMVGNKQIVNFTINKDLSSRLGPQKATVSSSQDIPKVAKVISMKRKASSSSDEPIRQKVATTVSTTRKSGVFGRLGRVQSP